jgi:amidase
MPPRSYRNRLNLTVTALLVTLLAGCSGSDAPQTGVDQPDPVPAPVPGSFELVEATVADIHAAFAGEQLLADGGVLSCVKLVQLYTDRIAAINDWPQAGGFPVRGVLGINSKALEQAAALDALYALEGIGDRPLHCVPMLLKDNYDTFDHPSSSGSLSMLGHQAAIDAHSVAGLRAAGALILGKAHQDEFAFTVSGTSGRGIRTSNPYDTRQDPGGSSSGSGASIAANFAAIGTGTDTCMSIRYPASVNGLVGIRGSVGLVSQHGVFPLTHSRDAPGPMARTVRDATLALSAMAGADERDFRTLEYTHPVYTERPTDYTVFLDRQSNGLAGRRIGFVTGFASVNAVGDGEHAELMQRAMEEMRALGAEIIEVSFPDFVSASASAMHFEWNEYFRLFEAEAGKPAPRRCLTALNSGQNSCGLFDGILDTGLVAPIASVAVASAALTDPDQPPSEQSLARHGQTRDYVEALMDAWPLENGESVRLDALLLRPGASPRTCDFGSTTQMPSIVVPIGLSSDGVPKGIEIMARRWDEPTAIGIAYDYEQATHYRSPPQLAANPLAGSLVFETFNDLQVQVLQEALNQDPFSLPVEEYLRLLGDYISGLLP